MKRFLGVTICLCCSLLYSQQMNCSKFHSGQFKFVDYEFSNYYSTRMDSIQIDSIGSPLHMKVTSRIKWLTSCKYEVEYIAVSDSLMNDILRTKMVIEIKEIDGDTITCQRVDNNYLTLQKMVKLKD